MSDSYNVKNIIKNLGIVIVIIVIFYFLTVLVSNNKKSTTNKDSEISVIQYESILLGNIFSMDEAEFYILVESFGDENIENYKSYITTYQAKEDSHKFYYVDLSSAFNKRYISDENNFDKDNLHVKGTCLLKIKDKKIVEDYTDSETITKKLKEISS